MPSTINTSQDPEYAGAVGHEKKFHKTHFEVRRTLKNRVHPKDDPEWEYVSVGRWRKIQRDATVARKRGGN